MLKVKGMGRRILGWLISMSLVWVWVTAAFLSHTDSAAAATVTVNMVGTSFNPGTITIDPGDTVVWNNTSELPHTVSASDNSWDSGNLNPGQSYSRTFTVPGTYRYYCKYHGNAQGGGMAGTVVVRGVQQQPTATAQPTPPAQPGVVPVLEADDQPLVDDTIVVKRVVAAQDGWINVHANSPNNTPGAGLGFAPVKAGENLNVKVKLSPAPKPGDKVWPMLHVDAGQAGVWEFPGPDVPVMVEGKIVMKQITILAPPTTPTIEAEDQPLVDGSILVKRVVAAQDGWVTVHANTPENTPGKVLGFAPVKAGENRNVRVRLDPAPRVGDQVWPMLHIDAGQVGVYEFPGPDVPVMSGGQIVMVRIAITQQAPLPKSGSGDIWWLLPAGAALLGIGSLLALVRRMWQN
jgi:plastocyanin